MFWDFPSVFASSRMPEMDIRENEEQYQITASLPQVRKDSVKVTPEQDHTICIAGVREFTQPEEQMGYRTLMKERVPGSFQRCVRLPSCFAPDHIKAEMRKEELTLWIPKRDHANNARLNAVEVIHSE